MKYFLYALFIFAIFQTEYVKVRGTVEEHPEGTESGYEGETDTKRRAKAKSSKQPEGGESGYEGDASETETTRRKRLEKQPSNLPGVPDNVYIDSYGMPIEIEIPEENKKTEKKAKKKKDSNTCNTL